MHVLAVICWALAWCCLSVATGAGWTVIRTVSPTVARQAVGWMAAGALSCAGFTMIGVFLWG